MKLFTWSGLALTGLLLLAVGVTGWVWSALSQPPTEIESSWGTGATGAAAQPVVVNGSGMSQSAPLTLAGGNYAVNWTATDADSNNRVGCYHSARLKATTDDRSLTQDLGRADVDGGQTKSGTQYLYNVARGSYYIDANSGCDWRFEFRQ